MYYNLNIEMQEGIPNIIFNNSPEIPVTIDGKHYKNVVFVHIPKTAGSSIMKYLRDTGQYWWINSYIRNHDPLFNLSKHNNLDRSFCFAVVRNPYTRAYSAYMQYSKANNLLGVLSFSQYLDQILFGKVSSQTPLLYKPQSFFTVDHSGEHTLDKIYKFENLKEFEKDFNTVLPVVNKAPYDMESYIRDYSQENIEIIENLYSMDFDNFGYDRRFTIHD